MDVKTAKPWGDGVLTRRDREVLSLVFGFHGDVQAFTDFATTQQMKAELRMCHACGRERSA